MNKEEILDPDSMLHKALFQQIRDLCLSFPGTNERLSHGAPTFFIDEKRSFVQYHVNHHGDGRIALWCAAPAGIQTMLVASEQGIYFVPPYVGHLGWVGMRLDSNAKWEEIMGTIGDAYLTRAPQKYKKNILNNKTEEM